MATVVCPANGAHGRKANRSAVRLAYTAGNVPAPNINEMMKWLPKTVA